MNNLDKWKEIVNKFENYYVFGTSMVGKRLAELIIEYGNAERFKGFVVSHKNEDDKKDNFVFELNEVKNRIENKGRSAIIMSISECYHPEVYEEVKLIFDEVIESIKYFSLEMPSDSSRPRIILNDADLEPEMISIRDEIVDEYFSNKHAFGETDFYQSFPRFGIPGQRPTDYRLEQYNLDAYLSKNKSVLDIGCNCGFFDMTIADKCKSIVALEYDATMSEFSKNTAIKLGITNILFVPGDFNEWYKTDENKFDIILSFAVHIWIGMKPEQYAAILKSKINNDGILLFESQNFDTDIRYDDFCNEFVQCGFCIKCEGMMIDDGINKRKFTIFQLVDNID